MAGTRADAGPRGDRLRASFHLRPRPRRVPDGRQRRHRAEPQRRRRGAVARRVPPARLLGPPDARERMDEQVVQTVNDAHVPLELPPARPQVVRLPHHERPAARPGVHRGRPHCRDVAWSAGLVGGLGRRLLRGASGAHRERAILGRPRRHIGRYLRPRSAQCLLEQLLRCAVAAGRARSPAQGRRSGARAWGAMRPPIPCPRPVPSRASHHRQWALQGDGLHALRAAHGHGDSGPPRGSSRGVARRRVRPREAEPPHPPPLLRLGGRHASCLRRSLPPHRRHEA
mmetsp:Transcript_43061/g.119086  ORF Transcript_43061/g.119086 Transcript_43061/m.119086 type:complete len:285 (-) Transcript_43061:786-1640(-)